MSIMKIIYIVIYVVLAITLVMFFIQLVKTLKKLTSINESVNSLQNNLDKANKKIEYIQSTEDSWSFFMSLYIILIIIRETFKQKKKGNGLGKSLATSCIRHSSQLSKIRF